MSRPARRWTACGLAGALLAMAPISSPGQEKTAPPKVAQPKADPSAERASGVIIKAEPVAQGGAARGSGGDAAKSGAGARGAVRLTINTAAVWRDWARDQAPAPADQSPRKAAERGANSIATKGEPESKDMLVVVQVGPDSKVETRFRLLTDETSKGASTPAGAREEAGAKGGEPGAKTQAAKPTRYSASDLKPGLFIEADFRRAGGENRASSVAVIRPVSDIVPASGSPAGK